MLPAHSYGREYLAPCYTDNGAVFSTAKSESSSTSNTKHEWGIDYISNISLGIRNVYCAQKQNTFWMVHQKCLLCTEKKTFHTAYPNLFTVHRNNIFHTVYLKYVPYTETIFLHCTSEKFTVHRNNNFQTVHQICVLCTQKNSTLFVGIDYCAQKQNTLRSSICRYAGNWQKTTLICANF